MTRPTAKTKARPTRKLSIRELAASLGASRSRLYEWRSRGAPVAPPYDLLSIAKLISWLRSTGPWRVPTGSVGDGDAALSAMRWQSVRRLRIANDKAEAKLVSIEKVNSYMALFDRHLRRFSFAVQKLPSGDAAWSLFDSTLADLDRDAAEMFQELTGASYEKADDQEAPVPAGAADGA